MPVKWNYILGVVTALAALSIASLEIIYIGTVFEDKSHFSYMLKSGDKDPVGPEARAHIQGVAAYGRSVAIRVTLSSAVFGLLVGFFASQMWFSKSYRQPTKANM